MSNFSGKQILPRAESANSPNQKAPAAAKSPHRSTRFHLPSSSNSSRAIEWALARHVDSSAGKIDDQDQPSSHVDLSFHESSHHLENFPDLAASPGHRSAPPSLA